MRTIVTYPDPVLSHPARELTDDEIASGRTSDGLDMAQLVDDMVKAMRFGPSRGVGLAAPQIGVGLRICMIEVSEKPSFPLVLFNPVLSEHAGENEIVEGCLSLPGIALSVKRPAAVRIVAKGPRGEAIDIASQGGLARIVQHEVDHLDGVMIIQRANIVGNKKVNAILAQLESEHDAWARRREKTKKDK